MAKISNIGGTKCKQGCGATETHSLLMGMQNDIATLEQLDNFFQS